MYNNIGKKIKALAKVCCWIGIIAAVISGIVVMVAGYDEIFILIGLLVMVAGGVLSWVSSFVLYGFGQLVDNSDLLVVGNKTVNTPNVKSNYQQDTTNQNVETHKGTCELCGATDIDVTYCKIVDNLGTRYRNICNSCKEKNNATPYNK